MNAVKIFPKIQKWEHWSDSVCVHILIYLLTEAKQKRTSYKGVSIQRGQVVAAGRGAVARGTGLAEGVVRGAVNKMLDSGDLSYEIHETPKGGKFTVITITNYDEYQRAGDTPKPMSEYAKKQEELRKNEPSKPFLEWWEHYKKGARGGAWVAWQKTAHKPPLDELIKITEQYKEYCASMERPMMDGQGWINQRYFDSEWTHEAQGTAQEGEGFDVKFG